MRALNHIHTLNRKNKTTRQCADPHCYYTVPNEEIRGRASMCGICGIKEVIMTSIQMKLSKPRCEDCSNRKEFVVKRQIKRTLENLVL